MRIGVDLGGTKIEAVAIDSVGNVVARYRVATPRDSYAGVVAEIGCLVTTIESEIGARCTVGVGTPGAISPASGVIKNANSTLLNGKDLQRDLCVCLGRTVRIHNDANCFALSEAIDGSGRGARVVFGVILGTGTGAGIVVNAEPLVGPNAIAGEWGHNPLPWPKSGEVPGPVCHCGANGCLETFLSGPGLSNAYYLRSGERVAASIVALRSRQGDDFAQACLGEYEHRLARGLAQVINILDPDVIVLGGGVSKIERLYENVPRLWTEFVFSDTVTTRLLRPTHGDSGGVRGAAWLWRDGEG